MNGDSLNYVKVDQQVLIVRDMWGYYGWGFFYNYLHDECPNPIVKGVELICGDQIITYKFAKEDTLVIGHEKELSFVYIVQVQNQDGVTVQLSWIEGSMVPNQRIQPQISWIPQKAGEYTATVFVWKNLNDPIAYGPSISTTVFVI